MIWLLILLIYAAAWGWARWLCQQSETHDRWLFSLTVTLALSFGVLSLLMFGWGLLRVPITVPAVTGAYLLLMLPGWWSARTHLLPTPSPLNLQPLHIFALLVLLSISAAILFNAVQWPFYRADALGIYVPFAEEISQTQALAPINPQRNLYELYPQLMSMNYAYVFMAAGWQNPYPARLIAALLSIGCLPAVYLLGRELHSAQSGIVAALLLALTPDFGTWASSGYVDLPMAFYYALGALFAQRMWQNGRSVDAVLAGAMFGFAAWTKNAALVGAGLFFIYLMYGLIKHQLSLKNVVLACCLLGGIASPWYLRNLLLAGALTPDTVWTEDASRTFRQAFVLVTLPQNYSLPGWLMLGGVFWGTWQIAASGLARHQSLVLLWWSVPYYVTWLLFASYDPRFILLFLPFLAVLAGIALSYLCGATRCRRMPFAAVMMLIIVVLAVQAMWKSVEYKRVLIETPLLTHEEKVNAVTNRN